MVSVRMWGFCLVFMGMTLFAEAKGKHSPIFMFEDFTEGIILLTNKNHTKAQFNYDCANRQLFYRTEDGEIRLLENTYDVDTLYIGSHKFIPVEGQSRFLECIQAGNMTLLVDWFIKSIYYGKKGAMGTVTQSGGIVHLKPSPLYMDENTKDNMVYKYICRNTYYLYVEGEAGKGRSFTNLKSFIRLFPEEKQTVVKRLAKRRKTDFTRPLQVAQLITMCQMLP